MIYTNSKIKQSNGPGVECQIPLTSGEGRSYQRGSERPLAPSRRAAASWASEGPGPSPAPQPESRADAHDRVRARGHHDSAAPFVWSEGDWVKRERSQARHSEGQEADRRQSALQWACPSCIYFQPSFPAIPASRKLWGWGGAAINNTARCE